jgi:hypothetical protein
MVDSQRTSKIDGDSLWLSKVFNDIKVKTKKEVGMIRKGLMLLAILGLFVGTFYLICYLAGYMEFSNWIVVTEFASLVLLFKVGENRKIAIYMALTGIAIFCVGLGGLLLATQIVHGFRTHQGHISLQLAVFVAISVAWLVFKKDMRLMFDENAGTKNIAAKENEEMTPEQYAQAKAGFLNILQSSNNKDSVIFWIGPEGFSIAGIIKAVEDETPTGKKFVRMHWISQREQLSG